MRQISRVLYCAVAFFSLTFFLPHGLATVLVVGGVLIVLQHRSLARMQQR